MPTTVQALVDTALESSASALFDAVSTSTFHALVDTLLPASCFLLPASFLALTTVVQAVSPGALASTRGSTSIGSRWGQRGLRTTSGLRTLTPTSGLARRMDLLRTVHGTVHGPLAHSQRLA